MYESWKRVKIQKDETIRGTLNLIADQYGYTITEGFGLHIQKKRKAYHEEKYAEVAYNGFSTFTISTVSSHWDIHQATIFMKQLKEATECAAELNAFISSLDYQLKREFKDEQEKIKSELNL